MSVPRFLVSQLPSSGIVEMGADESKHACNVLRLAPGDSIVLFDGNGSEALGTIADLSKRATNVLIECRTDTCRELDIGLEMLVAIPKGDRQKILVEGLTQLGVSRLTPLATERGVAQPTPSAIERMRRSVVEASKQCGRNRLMTIGEPISFAQLSKESTVPEQITLFAHPHADGTTVRELLAKPQESARIAIGPEGGFTGAETRLLSGAGWKQTTLGPRILRIETAAIALASLWSLVPGKQVSN